MRLCGTVRRYYNASVGTAPPKDLEVEATDLQDYITIMGSAPGRGGEGGPVTGVTIRGITIRDAGATYLEPHGMPSGGDWGLQRRGAVYLEGTEGVTIEACLFTRNDGNAVMLSGYNRDTLLKDIEAVPTPANIYAVPLRFKLGGRPILILRLNVDTARSERQWSEI